MGGPLSGLRVVEFAGIGPGPFAGMLLADLGAEVLLVERPGGQWLPTPVVRRGKHSLTLDIKRAEGLAQCREALSRADMLIEGFRPGVMERLGLGPEEALKLNPRLIYGRMTGWGQTGPLAHSAGHDINYIGLTGALAAMGEAGAPPSPPLNLVGDFGGGALYLVMGMLAALHERQRSGVGQVVDAAIVDGAASLMAMFAGVATDGFSAFGGGGRSLARERNPLSGASPTYRCYECADGRYLAVGPIEPQFLAAMCERLAIDPAQVAPGRPEDWPAQANVLAKIFRQRPRDDWASVFEGSDACITPVLEFEEAGEHPHVAAREVFIKVNGVRQPAPAPRFSRTPPPAPAGDPATGEGGAELMANWIRAGEREGS